MFYSFWVQSMFYSFWVQSSPSPVNVLQYALFFIIFLRTRQRRAKAEADMKSGQERLESTNQSGKAPEVKGPKYKSFLV